MLDWKDITQHAPPNGVPLLVKLRRKKQVRLVYAEADYPGVEDPYACELWRWKNISHWALITFPQEQK